MVARRDRVSIYHYQWGIDIACLLAAGIKAERARAEITSRHLKQE